VSCRRFAHIVPLLLWQVGCAGSEPTRPSENRAALLEAVTEAMAAHIGVDGRFILPAPSEGTALVPERDARDVAARSVRATGHMIGVVLEAQHGGSINYREVEACGQAYLSQTPFSNLGQDLPADTPVTVANFVDSSWIIATCDPSGTPVVSVAIAANAAIIRGESGGWSIPDGAVRRMVGIPSSWPGGLPMTPEQAVILASSRTGKRVSTLPTLHGPNPLDDSPQGSYWVFESEDEVSLIGAISGAIAGTTLLHVGTTRPSSLLQARGPIELFTPRPGQRTSVRVWLAPERSIVLQFKTDAAVDLEQAVVLTGGAR